MTAKTIQVPHTRSPRALLSGARFVLGAAVILLTGCASFLGGKTDAPDALMAAKRETARKRIQQLKSLSSSGEGRNYQIGVDDILEITVFQNQEMGLTTRVSGDGVINFPPVGEVSIGGMTEREAERELQSRLADGYLNNPHVMVFIKEMHSREAAIVGEVNAPGRYPLVGDEKLLNLISMAGGLTNIDSLRGGRGPAATAYVIRYGGSLGQFATLTSGSLAQDLPQVQFDRQRIKIDLIGLLVNGEEEWNIPLQSGDLVNIPDAGVAHITGRGIVTAGTYPLTFYPRTVLQLIDDAQGLRLESSNNIRLIRTDEWGRQTAYDLKYRSLVKNQENDVVLQSGDKIITKSVPWKVMTAGLLKAASEVVQITLYGRYDIIGDDTQ